MDSAPVQGISLYPLTPEELQDRVRKIIVEQLDIDSNDLLPSTRIHDLGTDSVGNLELSMAIEDAFDIEVPDADLDKLQTLNDVAGYLADRLGI